MAMASSAEIRRTVTEYYEAFLQRMAENERACPELFGQGATEFVREQYGPDLPPALAACGAVSLGCGDPVSLAALSPGERVLDLGCGPGLDCFLAAGRVGPSGHVIGVDLTQAMLDRAGVLRERLGLTNVTFYQGTMERLPLDAESVDVVISNCAINLAPDKVSVLRQVFRVLRPGGRFAFCDIVAEGELSPELRSDLRRWSGCVSGAQTAAQYRSLLRQAGLLQARLVEGGAAEGILEQVAGAPRLFVADITGRRPPLAVRRTSAYNGSSNRR